MPTCIFIALVIRNVPQVDVKMTNTKVLLIPSNFTVQVLIYWSKLDHIIFAYKQGSFLPWLNGFESFFYCLAFVMNLRFCDFLSSPVATFIVHRWFPYHSLTVLFSSIFSSSGSSYSQTQFSSKKVSLA